MLGFVLFSGVTIFIATIADDLIVTNKIRSLKTLTDNTALALAKHYIKNESIVDAETVATDLLDQSRLGQEISELVVYTWDLVSNPKNVKVTIGSYQQPTFWYKLLGKDNFDISNLESRADIVEVDPISQVSDTLAPLAINNCNRDDDLVLNNEIDFTFKVSDYYDNSHTDTFYAVDKDCSFPAGNSNFAHFKDLFSQGEVEYASYDVSDNETACLVQTSFENPLTVDPKQLYDQLKHFTLPYKIDILMFDCGTTKDDLLISNLLSVEIVNLYSLGSGTNEDGDNVNNLTIRTKIVPSDEKVMLKY